MAPPSENAQEPSEPDRGMPSNSASESPSNYEPESPSNSASKSHSTQPDDADEIKASAPATPDPEQLEELARTYLADTFQLELDSFRLVSGIEATIFVPGVSDQEDPSQAPEDWEDIQQRMVSAQEQLSEVLEMPNASSRLLVRDAGGKQILSVQQGRVNYDDFKAHPRPEPKPEPEPEPSLILTPPPVQSSDSTQNSDGQSWGDSSTTNEITGNLSRTAYWTTGGKSYHFSSSCPSLSRSKNIKSGTLQQALNAGKKDPCNNCANGS